jgi:type IV pilus assembly protein PilA
MSMTLRNRINREAGFSLIEILVVIVILGILMAIAVPSFFGAKNNGFDSKAQAAVRSALSAERTHYVDYQTYTTDQTALRKIESNITWNTTNSSSNGTMAAIDGTGQVVVLVSWSKSQKVFCIMNIAQDGTGANGQTQAGTYYAKRTAVSTAPAAASLDACGTSGYSRSETSWNG